MTATEALVQLFELLFGHADLERFVESRVGTAGIDGARAAVQTLELQGAVDAALFDRLREAFPSRAAEIEQAARDWLPDWTAAAPPARPAAAAEPESGARDIFIAHAGPDAPAAEVLCDALAGTGLDVFLDSRCLQLGDRWDDAIPAVLDAARLIVVLISGRTRDAWYTREEIAMAIDAARGRGAPGRVPPLVMPVYLERFPESAADWLYGLRRLQGMSIDDVGWPAGVASRLVERLDALGDQAGELAAADRGRGGTDRGQEAGAGGSGRPGGARVLPTTPLPYLHLALNLDRSAQWMALLRETRSERSGLFLLHGERRQNLELFVARLWHYLSDETERHQVLVQVPERWEGELPRSDAGWEVHLRHAFESGEGTAADLLADVARQGPLFLLIGQYPLSHDGLDGDGEVIAALEEFLGRRLPALLAGSRAPHPVRVLVATDHEPGEASLAARLYQRMRSGAERHDVRVRRLPEVTPVTWKHVEYFLDGRDPPPDARVYRRLRELYDQLDHDRISFQELAERLSCRL